MIDHVGFPVSDYERAKRFYTQALAPLGYVLVMEVTPEQTGDGSSHGGFGRDGKPDFWIGSGRTPGPGLHVAITASDRATVDAFHRAALPRAAATTVRRGCARTTTRATTARSCSTPTATTSRRSATAPSEVAVRAGPGRARASP